MSSLASVIARPLIYSQYRLLLRHARYLDKHQAIRATIPSLMAPHTEWQQQFLRSQSLRIWVLLHIALRCQLYYQPVVSLDSLVRDVYRLPCATSADTRERVIALTGVPPSKLMPLGLHSIDVGDTNDKKPSDPDRGWDQESIHGMMTDVNKLHLQESDLDRKIKMGETETSSTTTSHVAEATIRALFNDGFAAIRILSEFRAAGRKAGLDYIYNTVHTPITSMNAATFTETSSTFTTPTSCTSKLTSPSPSDSASVSGSGSLSELVAARERDREHSSTPASFSSLHNDPFISRAFLSPILPDWSIGYAHEGNPWAPIMAQRYQKYSPPPTASSLRSRASPMPRSARLWSRSPSHVFNENLQPGAYLVAHPMSNIDGPFYRTIIFITSYSAKEGATGVIINRTMAPQETLESLSVWHRARYMYGGPVREYVCLHSDDIHSSTSSSSSSSSTHSTDVAKFLQTNHLITTHGNTSVYQLYEDGYKHARKIAQTRTQANNNKAAIRKAAAATSTSTSTSPSTSTSTSTSAIFIPPTDMDPNDDGEIPPVIPPEIPLPLQMHVPRPKSPDPILRNRVLFTGISTWEPEQLEREIEAGLWMVLLPNNKDITETSTSTSPLSVFDIIHHILSAPDAVKEGDLWWSRACWALGGPYRELALIPSNYVANPDTPQQDDESNDVE